MLPRLYEVLSLIPANHTKDNPMFKSIKRSKMSDTSLYWNGTGEIAINGGETGPFSSKREKYNDSTGKKLEFSKFDAHTLHEVGHSVDDASGYMAKHQKDESHGGWKLTDSSGAAAAKAKAMQPAYKTLSLAFLRDVVAAVLGNGNADGAVLTWKGKKGGFDEITADGLRDDGAIKVADAGIKKVKDQVSVPLSSADKLKVSVEVPSLTELMKNSVAQGAAKQVVLGVLRNMTELVQTADEAIGGLKASIDAANDTALVGKLQKEAQDWGEIIKKELWYNPGAIAGAQAGGRVYQSDEGTWWSYSFAARSAAVNNYQWRSPAEWFAEVYTVEMLNKLDKSHPCSGKLRQIDTTQKIV
jgi:hypothetical protein